jgi:hypothetical protein
MYVFIYIYSTQNSLQFIDTIYSYCTVIMAVIILIMLRVMLAPTIAIFYDVLKNMQHYIINIILGFMLQFNCFPIPD